MASDAPLPLHKQIIAGGAAGIAEIACMYPTDVVKTRAQLSTASIGMIASFRNIIAEEGTLALYRGVASPIMAEAPKRACKFTMNEQYKSLLKDRNGQLPSHRAALAGALAGMTEAIVNCPFETIKVRMQAKENLNRFKSTMDCALQTIKYEGVLAVYSGFEPQLWRNAVWNGTYFGIIGVVRRNFKPADDASKAQKLGTQFVTGTIGGFLGTLANTPFDVVKSRMQNQIKAEGVPFKYNWVLPSLKTIYHEEGMAALYKGLVPRLVRLGPGGGIMIVAFDQVSSWLRNM